MEKTRLCSFWLRFHLLAFLNLLESTRDSSHRCDIQFVDSNAISPPLNGSLNKRTVSFCAAVESWGLWYDPAVFFGRIQAETQFEGPTLRG